MRYTYKRILAALSAGLAAYTEQKMLAANIAVAQSFCGFLRLLNCTLCAVCESI